MKQAPSLIQVTRSYLMLENKEKAHNNGLFDTIILKLKHFVVEFNDKCFVDFWVDFIAFWQASQ